MAVKKDSKKKLIIQAFMQCVVEQGLNSSSMSEIATKIGIDRSSLYHYFKSRDQLIDAMVEHVVEIYIEQFYLALADFFGKKERADQLVEHLFGQGFYQADLAAIMGELSVLGTREKHVRVQVKSIYQAVETAIAKELDLAFPSSPREDRLWTSYALVQLAEGCSVFTAYGFNTNRLEAGKKTAALLLANLKSTETHEVGT